MDKIETISFLQKNISTILQSYSKINQERVEAINYYNGSKDIVEVIEGRSSAVTNDLADVVEWALPAMLEIFCGQDKIVSVEPASAEDTEPARLMDLLVNYQLKQRNNWFLVIHDWIKDSLIFKTGVIKYRWEQQVKYIDKEYENLTEEEFNALSLQENVEILSYVEKQVEAGITDDDTGEVVKPPVFAYDCKARFKIIDEFPVIEAVPPEDFGLPIDARSIDDAHFIYHKIKLPKWKARQIYGNIVDEISPERPYTTFSDIAGQVTAQRISDLGPIQWYDKITDEIIVYECYYRDEQGNPRIATICQNTILYEDDNKYGRPPFEIISPIRMTHRAIGKGMYDLVKEVQKLRTALLRQIVDNLYQANYRRYFIDADRVNLSDYLNLNVTNAAIRVHGDPRIAVMPEEKAPIPPEIFQFWEMIQQERDYHSGVPRSYQGVLASVEHRTARGFQQQIQLASQRVQSMARIIAEIGIKPLVSDIIDMNIKFLKKKTAIRYLNEWIEINPDNLVGKFDISVNVGLGVPDKQSIIVQDQQLLGIYSQLFRAGVPVVNAQNVYNLMKQMLDAMGMKNTGDYITDPQVPQRLLQLFQVAMPLIQQNPQLGQFLMETLSLAGVPMIHLQQQIQAAMTQQQLGAEAPAQAAQPEQPVNPRTIPEGRGYYP